MTDEKLKEEFIKYFGEEKWNEEEQLTAIHKYEKLILEDLIVESVPVIVEDIKEDSRLDIKNQCIIISKNKIMDTREAVKCLVHEYRHLYQLTTVLGNITIHPFYELWKDDLSHLYNPENPSNDEEVQIYFNQPVEVDAFAYTKYFFRKFLNEELLCFSDDVEEMLDDYIERYLVYGM